LRRASMSGPASEEPREASYRVVVTSIGTAGGAVVEALCRALPLTAEELAARIVQAPSELVGGLDREAADRIAALLRKTGLEIAILEQEAAFQAGEGDLEVSLVPSDASRMPEIVAEIAHFLSCDRDTAQQILAATPSILVSKISKVTVAALRRRFEPLGVALAVSRPQTASYDVYLRSRDGDALRRLRRLLGSRCSPAPADCRSPVARALSYAEARSLWRDAERFRIPLRILNRDFLRLDPGADRTATSGGSS
jgi:hypothetical protein